MCKRANVRQQNKKRGVALRLGVDERETNKTREDAAFGRGGKSGGLLTCLDFCQGEA